MPPLPPNAPVPPMPPSPWPPEPPEPPAPPVPLPPVPPVPKHAATSEGTHTVPPRAGTHSHPAAQGQRVVQVQVPFDRKQLPAVQDGSAALHSSPPDTAFTSEPQGVPL